MASIQRLVSPLTGEVVYRAQVRRKGRRAESATFPNRKEAKAWAESLESAIRENRHFPHAAAKRTSFDALARDYTDTVLADFDLKEKATRIRQLHWWSRQFSGLSLAEITADPISQARDKLAAETFTRGRPRQDKKNPAGFCPPDRLGRESGTRHLDPHHVLEDSVEASEDRELVDLLGHLLQSLQLLQSQQRRVLIHEPRGVE